jgi:SagB-type dehydrogenase family enzyme
MTDADDVSFRAGQPVAWMFHRATCRWVHNTTEPPGVHLQQASKEDLDVELVALPDPGTLDVSLGRAIRERVSTRAYAADGLSLEQVSTILQAGYGVVGRTLFGQVEFLERAVPSGGGLYPLELYLIVRAVDGLEPGIHHYVPLHHGLELVRPGRLPEAFNTYLFLGQPYATSAAAVVVLTAVTRRSLGKYGDRGYRYLLLEAGHAAQNINLATVALGLGCCNLGGFFDEELAAVIRADTEEEIPLYGVALGVPSTNDRDGRRAI